MQTATTAEVVAVTGASAGLGRAIACEFAKHGAKVGLLARGRERLESARREVEAAGGQALVLPTDVANAAQVEAAASRIEEVFGPLDIWVNNAMVTVLSPVKDMTAQEYQRVMEVTYLGQVYGTLAALRRMLARDRGSIVLVGSALAYRGIPLQSAYCAAKHAIQGFSDSLHAELIHENSHVRLTMVQMPALNTPQFQWMKTRLPRKPQPVPPIYQPEVGAQAVYWAAHHNRREVFVGTSCALAIIGNAIAPGLGDRYLGHTGYESQQYNGPVDPNRRDNLWEPAPGDFGTHGEFDDRSHRRSPQWWMNTHRSWLGLAGIGAAALGAAGAALLRGRT